MSSVLLRPEDFRYGRLRPPSRLCDELAALGLDVSSRRPKSLVIRAKEGYKGACPTTGNITGNNSYTKSRTLPVSAEQLKEWDSSDKNLIVIDLITPSGRAESGTYCEPLPGALSVSMAELHDVFRWIPPLTTLVFCGRGEISRFDPNIEQQLLQAQINVVYWIVLPAAVSIPVKASPGYELDDSIFLSRTGQPGWTPFHSSQQTDSRN